MYLIKKLDLEQIADIYRENIEKHFPPDEIKPLKSIERMWHMGAYHGLGMYEVSKEGCEAKETEAIENLPLIGYAFFSQEPEGSLLLLDYFAILEQYRGMGIGGVFLKEMRGFLDEYKGILLETEDADFARNEEELQIRQKRDAFYQKNGVIKTDIKGKIYGVNYAIWTYPIHEIPDFTECKESLERLYRIMIPGEKYEKFVRIWS